MIAGSPIPNMTERNCSVLFYFFFIPVVKVERTSAIYLAFFRGLFFPLLKDRVHTIFFCQLVHTA